MRILINCIVVLLLGVIVAFSISKEYISCCSVAPEIQEGDDYDDYSARKCLVCDINMIGLVQLIIGCRDIQQGCKTVVSSKKNKQKLFMSEYSAMGISAVSVVTMLVSIANLLK